MRTALAFHLSVLAGSSWGSQEQAPLKSEHSSHLSGLPYIFSNRPTTDNGESSQNGYGIPTSYESAVMARRIMHLTSYGQLTSTYPSHQPSHSGPATEMAGWPSHLSGSPVTLMEYIADCEPETGNPTLLAVDIATPYVNWRAGSNISLSLQWTPPEPKRCYKDERLHLADQTGSKDDGPALPYSAAKLPRFALFGYLEEIEPPTTNPRESNVEECFLSLHPDSHLWLPGRDDSAHVSRFMRLVVEDLYWFGGFGDRAYIGWIDVEKEWKKVTRKEIEAIRLPGEKHGKGDC
jgi:hypothetical protein